MSRWLNDASHCRECGAHASLCRCQNGPHKINHIPDHTSDHTCSRCREVPAAEDSWGMCRLCASLEQQAGHGKDGRCVDCGRTLTTQEAIRSDACPECDPPKTGRESWWVT